jgi:hypothetical protein
LGDWGVEADRLSITLEGYLAMAESKASSDAVVEAASNAVESIERGKEAVAENGASAAVRIQPESTTGKMQFERAGDNPTLSRWPSRSKGPRNCSTSDARTGPDEAGVPPGAVVTAPRSRGPGPP